MKKSFKNPSCHFWSWIKEHIFFIFMPALLLGFNRFWYLLARLITHTTFSNGGGFFEWALPIDHEIPFVDFFVIPYIASFLYWIVIPFVIYGVMGKKVFYRFVGATLLAELLGFVWLVLLPSKMSEADYNIRSTYANNPLYGIMDKLVFQNDLPDNLSPSFHVLSTFLPFVACFSVNNKNKHNIGMIFGTGIAFVLVALSTLFVRQHYVVDIFSAMALVGIAYLVVRIWKWDIFFMKINDWWVSKLFYILPNKIIYGTNNKKIVDLQFKIAKIFFTICFILCSVAVIGLMVYFGAISCVSGDPFQGLWKFGLDGLWPK